MTIILETPFKKGMLVHSILDKDEKLLVIGFTIYHFDEAGQVTAYMVGCHDKFSEVSWRYPWEIEEDN